MVKKSGGFTLVELMITMIIFVLVIAGASQVFTGLLTQFKQQSKISETNTQGIAGLEILRRDIEQAGYGLPWDLNGATYRETVAESGMTAFTERDYNDGPDNNPWRGCTTGAPSNTCDPGSGCNPPAPFRSGNDLGITPPGGSGFMTDSQADVLVIKSAPVAMNTASQKWTYIAYTGVTAPYDRLKTWGSSDDPLSTDQLIVLCPGSGSQRNVLQNAGGNNFFATLGGSFSFSATKPSSDQFEPWPPLAAAATPPCSNDPYVILYDIAPQDSHSNHIRMPFNRADYFVKRPQTNMPARCAKDPDDPTNQGTGILYKSVTNNTLWDDKQCPGGGGCTTLYPILDCVADMQVVYVLDNANSSGNFVANGDGTADWCPDATHCSTYVSCNKVTTTASPTASPTGDISCLTAYEIRNEVKEVRVYIVAQEGQRDTTYDFSQGGTRTSLSATIVDPNNSSQSMVVNTVNLKNLLCPSGAASCANEYKYYRWKLYTLVVHPDSMR